jgi:hypothetical protein
MRTTVLQLRVNLFVCHRLVYASLLSSCWFPRRQVFVGFWKCVLSFSLHSLTCVTFGTMNLYRIVDAAIVTTLCLVSLASSLCVAARLLGMHSFAKMFSGSRKLIGGPVLWRPIPVTRSLFALHFLVLLLIGTLYTAARTGS